LAGILPPFMGNFAATSLDFAAISGDFTATVWNSLPLCGNFAAISHFAPVSWDFAATSGDFTAICFAATSGSVVILPPLDLPTSVGILPLRLAFSIIYLEIFLPLFSFCIIS
jgi:hypothetical protein